MDNCRYKFLLLNNQQFKFWQKKSNNKNKWKEKKELNVDPETIKCLYNF